MQANIPYMDRMGYDSSLGESCHPKLHLGPPGAGGRFQRCEVVEQSVSTHLVYKNGHSLAVSKMFYVEPSTGKRFQFDEYVSN